MSTSARDIAFSLVALSWLAGGCSDSSKKVDLGGGCLLNSDCNSPLSCTFGKCHTACVVTRDCPLGQACVQTPEGGVCQFPADSDCQSSGGVCPIGLVCAADQRCRKSCQTAAECLAGQACSTSGVCADSNDLDGNGQLVESGVGVACVASAECNSILTCTMNRCHYPCQSTNLCPSGQSCVNTGSGAVCQLPVEALCDGSVPCPGGLVCAVDYRCRAPCGSASDCTTGQKCTGGVCADSGDLNPGGQLPPKSPPVISRDAGAPDAAVADIPVVSPADAALEVYSAEVALPDVREAATGEAAGGRDGAGGAGGAKGTGGTGIDGGKGTDGVEGGGTGGAGGGGTAGRRDSGQPEGGIWYVDQASAGGDGKSWSGAFTTLQSALANSELRSGDQIWIAKGTYTPAASGGSRTTYFYLVNGVALFGGFHGTEAKLAERDNPVDPGLTVLSGDIGANDGVDAKGALINRTENSYHVVVGASNAVLDGLTITGGNANGSASEQQQGGGMYNLLADGLRIANVRFVLNLATGSGGGCYNAPSSYTTQDLTNVIFVKNQAGSEGGGFYNGSGNATLTDVTFANNSAANGGGMTNASGDPAISRTTFVGNTTGANAGGLHVAGGNPKIANTIISGNLVSTPNQPTYGGGMDVTGGSPMLVNVSFVGNMINNNTAVGLMVGGGGIALRGGNSVLTNVTFSANWTNVSGGSGLYYSSGSPKVTNAVIWGNYSGSTVNEIRGTGVNFSHSAVHSCGGSSAWSTACGTDAGGNLDSATSPFAAYRAPSGSWSEAPAYSASSLRTTFTNALAPWVPGELVGMFVQPDTSQPRRLPIVSNTATTLTVWGDAASSAASGTMYSLVDLRLASGSGCIDTGDTTALPVDSCDVNGDGNTAEVIPWDLNDQPRVVNGTVDMGACEYQGD
jgi:hypothetical protein